MISFFLSLTALIEQGMLAAIVDYCDPLRLPIRLRSEPAPFGKLRAGSELCRTGQAVVSKCSWQARIRVNHVNPVKFGSNGAGDVIDYLRFTIDYCLRFNPRLSAFICGFNFVFIGVNSW